MALVSMRQLLDHAAENGYGLPAFNVNNLEQVQAIMAAADQVGAPVIMQASAGARKYSGEPFLRHLIEAAIESYPHIPVVMHQDHGQSLAVCMAAIQSGFTSVMMDGSLQADGKTVASYEYNVDVSRKVVEMAHSIGVTVEAVFGSQGARERRRVFAQRLCAVAAAGQQHGRGMGPEPKLEPHRAFVGEAADRVLKARMDRQAGGHQAIGRHAPAAAQLIRRVRGADDAVGFQIGPRLVKVDPIRDHRDAGHAVRDGLGRDVVE